MLKMTLLRPLCSMVLGGLQNLVFLQGPLPWQGSDSPRDFPSLENLLRGFMTNDNGGLFVA